VAYAWTPRLLTWELEGGVRVPIIEHAHTLLAEVGVQFKQTELTFSLPVVLDRTVVRPLGGAASTDVGELRMGLQQRIFKKYRWAMRAGAWLALPTGSERDLTGYSATYGGMHVAGSWKSRRVVLTLELGYEFIPEVEFANTQTGDVVHTGFSADINVTPWLSIPVELRALTGVSGDTSYVSLVPAARLEFTLPWGALFAGVKSNALSGFIEPRVQVFTGLSLSGAWATATEAETTTPPPAQCEETPWRCRKTR